MEKILNLLPGSSLPLTKSGTILTTLDTARMNGDGKADLIGFGPKNVQFPFNRDRFEKAKFGMISLKRMVGIQKSYSTSW